MEPGTGVQTAFGVIRVHGGYRRVVAVWLVAVRWALVFLPPTVGDRCVATVGRCPAGCIDRPSPANFDIYCHEYPFEEYVAVSDEIKSWREFGPYVAGVVFRFGQDSL